MEKNNKKSETLSQREKAQRDFLELKKMQRENLEKENKHIPYSEEKKPKTFKEKIENIWYHYKALIIVGAVIVLALGYITVTSVNKKEPDLRVVVYDNRVVPDMYLVDMENYFKTFCKDYNGDGEVVVTIMNCSFETGQSSAEYQQIMQQKLSSIVVTDKEAMLFVTSDTGYEYLQGIVDTPFLKEEGKELSQDFYGSINLFEGIKMPDDLKIYCREIEGTLIENDKTAKESVTRAEEFLKDIK